MSERSFAEFLQTLEVEGAQAAEDEQMLLHSDVSVTAPRFSPQQLASSARGIADRLARAQRERRDREAAESPGPDLATVVAPAAARRPASPPPAAPVQTRQKFCRQCGGQLKAGKRFCTKCGARAR